MRIAILVLLGLIAHAPPAEAAAAKIKKVLIHYLDKDGRHTTAPSLYERDAYQAHLRAHPEERFALRADIHWRGPTRPLTLRVQLRGTQGERVTTAEITEKITPHSGWARWSRLPLKGEAYREFGELIAWRVTVWDGENLLAEQKSFLW